MKGRCGSTVHDASHNHLSKFSLVFTFADHDWTDQQMEALENALIEYANLLHDLFTGVTEFRHSAPAGYKSTFKYQKKSKKKSKKEGSVHDGEYYYKSNDCYFDGFVKDDVKLTDKRASTRYGVRSLREGGGGDLSV